MEEAPPPRLVVGRLEAEDHALLESRVDSGADDRRVVSLYAPSVADVVAPIMAYTVIADRLHSRVEWHYTLEPLDDDLEALTQRARDLRSKVSETETPTGQGPPPDAPDDEGG